MNKTISFLAILLVGVSAVHSQSCFDFIKKLAVKDKCLASRIDVKSLNAKKQTKEMFWTNVATSRCTGTAFACGKTMSWVTEVFEGLSSQYTEHKLDDYIDGSKIGYSYLVGDELRNLFKSNKNLLYPVIYRIRFTGDEDHVWVIEQLASNGGYRIYQSYHDAYSLKAWLSRSLDGLFNAVSGDIMIFNEVKYLADQLIQKMTGGKLNINSNWQNSSLLAQELKPFLQYVKDYDQTTAVNNFKRAWNKYGKGQVIPWSSFETYLNTLADMAAYFKKVDNTATLFSEKVWNDWIDLFASPNPVHFPNFPTNGLTSIILPGKIFRFEVKKVELKSPPNCYYNAFYIQ